MGERGSAPAVEDAAVCVNVGPNSCDCGTGFRSLEIGLKPADAVVEAYVRPQVIKGRGVTTCSSSCGSCDPGRRCETFV